VLKKNNVTFIRDIHQPVSQEDTDPSSDSAE